MLFRSRKPWSAPIAILTTELYVHRICVRDQLDRVFHQLVQYRPERSVNRQSSEACLERRMDICLQDIVVKVPVSIGSQASCWSSGQMLEAGNGTSFLFRHPVPDFGWQTKDRPKNASRALQKIRPGLSRRSVIHCRQKFGFGGCQWSAVEVVQRVL